jgi:branched-chain amino acid aminotransferase
MNDPVWLDGALCGREDALFALADRGLSLGEGLFETMRWQDGAIRRFAAHWARLAAAAQALDLPLPHAREDVLAAAAALAASAGLREAAVRLMLTGGEGPRGLAPPPQRATRMALSLSPLPQAPPARLVTVSIRRLPGAPSTRFKTLSYIDQVAALREARLAGGDEAVMFNPHGQAASAAAATLILITRSGEALTPPLSAGALPGVTRGALLAAGALREAAVTADLLAEAPAMALANALSGVRPALALDGRALAPDHPALAALRAAEISSS